MCSCFISSRIFFNLQFLKPTPHILVTLGCLSPFALSSSFTNATTLGESRHLTSSSLGLNFRQLPPGKSQRKTTAAKSVWRLLVSLQCPFQLDCCHGNPHVSLQIVLIFTHPRALRTQSYQRLVTIKTKTTVLCGLGLAVSVLFNFLLPRGLYGEGSGNPLQYSCLGNAMDGGAW